MMTDLMRSALHGIQICADELLDQTNALLLRSNISHDETDRLDAKAREISSAMGRFLLIHGAAVQENERAGKRKTGPKHAFGSREYRKGKELAG